VAGWPSDSATYLLISEKHPQPKAQWDDGPTGEAQEPVKTSEDLSVVVPMARQSELKRKRKEGTQPAYGKMTGAPKPNLRSFRFGLLI